MQTGSIPQIQPLTYGHLAKGAQPVAQGTPSFGEMLKNTLSEVNREQNSADDAVKNLATGRDKDIHHTMIEMEKASVSLNLMMQVRNKVLDAYQEIMRMSV
ncbi:flagellar hook-basal body complex protein FliE [Desulfatirhabdium butyrativorans]|uniref:flagellar hook-basal body complex protein FliE n=1 Tax=Desulfatirhabdium butyrativorans TaxID=340467 RepID=UPI00040165A6|nr:flagellar hook-basal body complex protein FliE [Desulfatirhabdium butyrativorans]